ncbi:hypothetical protein [Desertimonas flava]|uniref:hypothetical protein n=1 Tax=Desertimonas flava TaxID=2064846 RepID=UPI0013C4E821|nr:hypothetical protein [Desertimonas flava]
MIGPTPSPPVDFTLVVVAMLKRAVAGAAPPTTLGARVQAGVPGLPSAPFCVPG